jgi:type II secretory pathway pseudopilin PulG
MPSKQRNIMTDKSAPTPATTRMPEEHAHIRRRAFPIASAGVLLGSVALALTLTSGVNAFQPPSLLAANLAFCAMLMGAAMLFYARGTPGARPAAVASLASLLLGMTATFLFTAQAVHSRQAREDLELANIRAIATAGNEYAAAHQGAYPPNLQALIQAGLDPRMLQSPYGQHKNINPKDLAPAVDDASDYLYLAGDLQDVSKDAAPTLLVAVSKNTVLRVNLALAFADGTSRFVTLDEISPVITACNSARAKLNLPPLKTPPIIQSALDDQKGR